MWFSRILAYAAIGYAALCLLVYFAQRRLLYFPESAPATPRQLEAAGLRLWPFKGAGHRGYIATGSSRPSRGLFVVFHGNAGAAWHRDYYVRALTPLGFSVLLAEYPAYGGRPGKLSEKNLVADARETVRLARQRFEGPLYLCGESLGAGVAAAVAAEPPVALDGMLLITPWDTLPDLAQAIYWFLPVRWLARDRYDSVRNLGGFAGPVAVALAERDEIIPRRHSMRLYESLPGKKRLWIIPEATHNTWANRVDTGWWKEIAAFLEAAGPGGGRSAAAADQTVEAGRAERWAKRGLLK